VLPEKVALDAGFGRLIGLFLAEGNCDSGKAVWTFGLHERETLVAETVGLLERYGVVAHIRGLPVHNSCKVIVHGTAWTRLLSSLCGNGAGLKQLHPDLTNGPREFLAEVLSGWLDGDGHLRSDGAREGITISPALALGMYDIAQALGRHPTIVRSEPVMNGHAATRRPRWEITMAPGRGRCREDAQHVWRKVRELVLEDYVGPVYDLTVEGDHSYVAEGVGVHNCVPNTGVERIAFTDAVRPGLTSVRYAGRSWPLDETLVTDRTDGWYHEVTSIDPFEGTWPPTDTGSDGTSLGKLLKSLGLIDSYTHAFGGLPEVLSALMSGPVPLGVPWYDSMFQPARSGELVISPDATVAGGHEFNLDGEIDVQAQRVWMTNHWYNRDGTPWGLGGRAWLSFDTLTRLLGEDGDATIMHTVPAVLPAPTPPAPAPPPFLPGLTVGARARLAARAAGAGMSEEQWVTHRIERDLRR
jgi:hypothetical protein